MSDTRRVARSFWEKEKPGWPGWKRRLPDCGQGFEIGEFRYRFSRSLAQALHIFRPGADNPELVEILRNDVELVTLVGETFDGINRLLMHGMRRVGKPS